MHPAIAMFPSDLFYGGLLKNGVSAPERRPLPGFPWPREEFPVAFIPVKGIEMDDGVSKYNEMEAEAACDAVKMLLQGGKVCDIAVPCLNFTELHSFSSALCPTLQSLLHMRPKLD
jgi:AAA domain